MRSVRFSLNYSNLEPGNYTVSVDAYNWDYNVNSSLLTPDLRLYKNGLDTLKLDLSGEISFVVESSARYSIRVDGWSSSGTEYQVYYTYDSAPTPPPVGGGGGGSSGEVITGTPDADWLHGTSGDDTIYAYSGDDILEGSNGDDLLDGGDGDDFVDYSYISSTLGVIVNLNTGESAGPITQGSDFDVLVSIEGVLGSDFDDQIIGNDLDNSFIGRDGDDEVWGLGGNDIFTDGEGSDFYSGGQGARDAIWFWTQPAGVSVNLESGEVIDAWGNEDTVENIEDVAGSPYDDVIVGNELPNFLLGLDGNDSIVGAGGDDLLSGGEGNDTIDGGEGIDTVSFHGEFADFDIGFDEESERLTVSLIAGQGNTETLQNVEWLRFGDQDVLTSMFHPNNPATGPLLLYGDATIGNTLLAEPRAITDEDGLGNFGYQWYRNGEAIQGKTSNTYLLSSSDDGQLITASVSYEDGAGNEEIVYGESRLPTDPTSDSYTDLIEMYVIILGRAPAQGGLDFWSGFINQGKDFEYIAGEMWNSEGAREFYPADMTTEEVVTSVYINILVREPKEAGLNYWVGQWEENGPVDTMLEMIGALTANNSSDPLAIADKELFQSKVDIGGYLANTVHNTDVELAGAAFDYLEAGYSVEETKSFIDTEMGIIGQANISGGDDMFA